MSAIDKHIVSLAIQLFILAINYALLLKIEDYCITESPNGKYKYDIIIDDSVSFNEFVKRYEILYNDDYVYTVIEKEI